MIETAYEMRNSANVMVSSEELEPGDGWDYTEILSKLTAKPSSSAQELGSVIVEAYENYYKDSDVLTLSSIDLGRVEDLVSALNLVVASANSDVARDAAVRARAPMTAYSDGAFNSSVDLGQWLSALKAETSPPELKRAADQALLALDVAVLDNYASTLAKPLGSLGLAIFFPKNADDFRADPDHDGYVVSNAYKPVAFVKETQWPIFLRTSFGIPTQ